VDINDDRRVRGHRRVQRVAVRPFDEDGRDRHANLRATHRHGTRAVVVVHDGGNGASVLGVHHLGGEEADAATDQGDLAGHRAVGEGASDGSGVGSGAIGATHASVERVGDHNCCSGEVSAVDRLRPKDGVTRGVETSCVVNHQVVCGAVDLRWWWGTGEVDPEATGGYRAI